MGARPGKDGIDAIETDASNCMNLPAESIELDFPIRINQWRLRPDSGGPGRWRGGLGFVKSFEAIGTPVEISYRGERHSTAPWGIAGGGDGAMAQARAYRAMVGSIQSARSRLSCFRPASGSRSRRPGGAGYGLPSRRRVPRVEADLLDHKISRSSRCRTTGVARAARYPIDDDCQAIGQASG